MLETRSYIEIKASNGPYVVVTDGLDRHMPKRNASTRDTSNKTRGMYDSLNPISHQDQSNKWSTCRSSRSTRQTHVKEKY